jgi:zinc/manganese transport system ATP-binding protein
VTEALEAVAATAYADAPVGRLSGGEQQRLRIAQALVGNPKLLLCDEPLASLDMRYQQEITELIGNWSREKQGTVVFVTHDVNPVLGYANRVVFVVNGRWAAGSTDEVLTSETMSELYHAPVEVLRVRGRIVVVGGPREMAATAIALTINLLIVTAAGCHARRQDDVPVGGLAGPGPAV